MVTCWCTGIRSSGFFPGGSAQGIKEVLGILFDTGVRMLPVVDDGYLLDKVTQTDLMLPIYDVSFADTLLNFLKTFDTVFYLKFTGAHGLSILKQVSDGLIHGVSGIYIGKMFRHIRVTVSTGGNEVIQGH